MAANVGRGPSRPGRVAAGEEREGGGGKSVKEGISNRQRLKPAK